MKKRLCERYLDQMGPSGRVAPGHAPDASASAPLPEWVFREMDRKDEIEAALEESVKLQSHYATLLNGWDGGQRMTFPSASAWMTRLAMLRTSHQETDAMEKPVPVPADEPTPAPAPEAP